MDGMAVVFEQPGELALRNLALIDPTPEDVVVDVECSGISTGTERLLWNGTMPAFPGLQYPLVPGYEAVGHIVEAGSRSGRTSGERVFVPGAACFLDARGLFGGTASRLVVPGSRVQPTTLRTEAVLLALAATAYHAVHGRDQALPDLIVGHGVLGRLMARIVLLHGGPAPTVWEQDAARMSGSIGYAVMRPEDDPRRDYRCACDVSGDSSMLDRLIPRLAAGGEVVLAGFYSAPLSFHFPAAFMREARIRVAAQWSPSDLRAVHDLATDGELDLGGLITHQFPSAQANDAYRTAFEDHRCLKMVLDWRTPR